MREDNRRNLLKKLGISSIVGAGGIATMSDIGSAAIAADGSGSVPDSEWDSFESFARNQESSDTSTDAIAGPGKLLIPNPVDLGFDVCATEPDGDQLCASTFTLGEERYEECAGRTLSKWGFSVEHEILQNGELTVNWGIDCWIGIDSNNCIWAGVGTTLDECSRVACPDYPSYDPSLTDVEDMVWNIATDLVDWIRENGNGYPRKGSSSETALIALLAVAVFLIILAPPPGILG